MKIPSVYPNSSQQISTHSNNSHTKSLCKKIIKLLAVIFLTIITLGLFLVWKCCCPPRRRTISLTQVTEAKPIFIFNSQGQLFQLPAHIEPGSLEFLSEVAKLGCNPTSSQMLTQFGELNPKFIASYPHEIPSTTISDLQRLTSSTRDVLIKKVSEAQLNQLNYLNQHYYLVTVPGDNNCFFSSYAISWLHFLHTTSKTDPNIFKQEIQRLLQQSFAKSSLKNAQLTKKVIRILHKSQACSSVSQLYNEIFLSHPSMQTLVQYLKQLSFYVADQQKCDILGESGLRALLIAQIKENPLLLEHAVLQCFGLASRMTQQFLASVLQPGSILCQTYQNIIQCLSNISLAAEQQEQLRQAVNEFSASLPPSLTKAFIDFKLALTSQCSIPAPAPINQAIILFLFCLQQQNNLKNQTAFWVVHSLLMPYLNENLRKNGELVPFLIQTCKDLCSDTLTLANLDTASLLISLLMRNNNLDPDLQKYAQQLLHHMTLFINDRIQSPSRIDQYKSSIPEQISARHPSALLEQMMMDCIEHMSLQDLLNLSRAIYFQAEDEHVLALSSSLGRLSLCQSLRDGQFSQNPVQVLSLAEAHGFLSLDFLPEHQGSVFVFKEDNHYSALLPKPQMKKKRRKTL